MTEWEGTDNEAAAAEAAQEVQAAKGALEEAKETAPIQPLGKFARFGEHYVDSSAYFNLLRSAKIQQAAAKENEVDESMSAELLGTQTQISSLVRKQMQVSGRSEWSLMADVTSW